MKKNIFIPTIALICLCTLLASGLILQKHQKQDPRNGIIRLHVRANDNSPEEQSLKFKVRDAILRQTQDLLDGSDGKEDARVRLLQSIPALENTGREVLRQENIDHNVTVTLGKEHFEYREYGTFFLPEGEYESLIVTIGEGAGENWWCVVFPAACYVGAGEEIRTDGEKMPTEFRLATKRAEKVEVRWGILEWIKKLFD